MADRRSFLGTLLVVTCGARLRAPFDRLQDSLPMLTRRAGGTGAVTPEQFGAVGDGQTDDTHALQSALDAAGTSGDTVTLRGVTYRTTTTLTVPAPVRITGVAGSVILKDHGKVGLFITPAAATTGAVATATATTVKLSGDPAPDGRFAGHWIEIAGDNPQHRLV